MSTISETRVPGLSDAGAITVVIVDDHLLVADSLAATLDATDDVSVVAVAGTGADGLAQVRRHQPDVLLLDYRLPDGSGLKTLPSLKQSQVPGTRLVIKSRSRGHRRSSASRPRRRLRGGFVPKGGVAAALLAAVRKAANGETIISPADLRRLMPWLMNRQARLGDDLTAREREVLGLLVDGLNTGSLARRLVISPATARNRHPSGHRALFPAGSKRCRSQYARVSWPRHDRRRAHLRYSLLFAATARSAGEQAGRGPPAG